jgi:hypothetical protein
MLYMQVADQGGRPAAGPYRCVTTAHCSLPHGCPTVGGVYTQVVIKAADKLLDRHARQRIAGGVAPALAAAFPALRAERVYLVFEEVPVEAIAVGTAISSFTTMRTAASAPQGAGVGPD